MEYDPALLEGASKRRRHDMWRTAAPDAAAECGIEERCFGPVQVTVISSLPHSRLINQVLGAAEPRAVRDGHLAAAIEWADSLCIDYRVPVARRRPEAVAAEELLNRAGFEQGRGLVKYVRDASWPTTPGVPGVTVWNIDDEEAAGETMFFDAAPALGLPSAAGILLFELPVQENWRTYTTELEGQIVAFGSMLIHEGAAVLDLDATLEEFRNRGCNQALLRRRLIAAFEAGCHTVAAELPEGEDEGVAAAVRNLLRAGFVPAYRSMCWQRPRRWDVVDESCCDDFPDDFLGDFPDDFPDELSDAYPDDV
jgi:GNAT superfamily N-acetyltransferase